MRKVTIITFRKLSNVSERNLAIGSNKVICKVHPLNIYSLHFPSLSMLRRSFQGGVFNVIRSLVPKVNLKWIQLNGLIAHMQKD